MIIKLTFNVCHKFVAYHAVTMRPDIDLFIEVP